MPRDARPAPAEQPPPVAAGPGHGDDAARWDLYVRPAGQGRIPVTFPEDAAEARYRRDGREGAGERARHGTVAPAARGARAGIASPTRDARGVLPLPGGFPRAPRSSPQRVARRP